MGQLDYALIGNCQSSALIDRRGRIAWACLPRFDSEAIFASLLGDEEAGFWEILPEAGDYEVHQRYVPNTNVVTTEFRQPNGDAFEVVDYMPRFLERDEYFRPPQIVRVLRPLSGTPRVCVRFRPRFNYGSVVPDLAISGDGLVCRSGMNRVFLRTDVPLTYVTEERPFELGGSRVFVLSHGEPIEYPLALASRDFLERTLAYWRTWVKHCRVPFEYQELVIRSALALKLHIFEDTGAIIAATTTSIPESPDGGRNWDYRYCWLRDSYFVIGALNRLGHFEEREKFIQYLHNLATEDGGGALQPVYGISGERELRERELPWLKGFGGFGPVRVGNAAYTHDQHDVYGEMVLAVAPIFFDTRLDQVDHARAFHNVRRLVEQAISVFDRRDSGIWEFRSEQRHYVFSKLMCWAAVDRGIKIAAKLGRSDEVSRWPAERDRMRAYIEREGWNAELGFYSQVAGGKDPDASNLLMWAVNFHSGRDEKFLRMVEHYEKSLVHNGYMFRYRNQDDFGWPKHAFTVCTFWLIDALVAVGRRTEAREIFARVLSRANHVSLLSEDVEPVHGELWGNFPQAYSHVGVINSAFLLSKSWDEAF